MRGRLLWLSLSTVVFLGTAAVSGCVAPAPADTAVRQPTATPEPTATPTPIPPTETALPESPFEFYSEFARANYRIYVSLPASYDPASSERYPVIYLLDADWYFDGSHWRMTGDGVTGIVAGLGTGGAIPESILVGIGYMEGNGRDTDFLFWPDRFYRFLTEELIPLIAATYPADTACGGTLIGHSDGGYFAMYALFHSGDQDIMPFTRFIAISGDYTKNDCELYADELRLYERIGESSALNATLYMAVGGREEGRFVNSNQDIAARLSGRGYEGFRLRSEEYATLTHSNIVRPAIVNGLTWVFGEE